MLIRIAMLVIITCAVLTSCGAGYANSTAYPSLPVATSVPAQPQSPTPNATDIASSVGPGTPAGAAVPAATSSTFPPGGQTSGCGAWQVTQAIDLPSPFAPNFPVPKGMQWYKNATIRNDAHTQLQVTGIVPLSLADSAKFLMSELPKAGYEITNTDSESNEADGLYKGNGWIGSYRVSALDNCDNLTMWSVRVLKL